MNNLNLEDIQLLASLAAASQQQQQAQQQVQQQQHQQAQQQPPSRSSQSMAKPRTPTPTLNGVANSSTSSNGVASGDAQSQSKYQQLLSVIEEMSKDIRPTYAGSKSSAERLKRGIVYARILVRECLVETERSARA